jgi:hypothetical protein
VSFAGAGAASPACHADASMLPVLFGALERALVDCTLYVAYVPNVTSMAWTMMLV